LSACVTHSPDSDRGSASATGSDAGGSGGKSAGSSGGNASSGSGGDALGNGGGTAGSGGSIGSGSVTGGGGSGGASDPSPVQRVLDYLYSISGSKTVAGQHNREPNAEPAKWTNQIHSTTGRYPGLWSGDFLFQADNISNRATMIAEAKRKWESGALVNIMWHACPPNQGEPCQWQGGLLSHLSDSEWEQLITDGTALNTTWKSRLDAIAVYLAELQAEGVAVLWRPLHEMNQGAFWWGGRPGPNGTRRLYQITHDYLVKTKGLQNLIWVWNVQDLSWDFADYNPGDAYWDIASLDVYGDGFTTQKYAAMLEVAGDKPIAIGECQRLPTASELVAQPRWVFFMGWAELVYESNSVEELRDLYSADNVLTLDEMPGW
jgi:mannan endo-1,4-beta-mannosidase